MGARQVDGRKTDGRVLGAEIRHPSERDTKAVRYFCAAIVPRDHQFKIRRQLVLPLESFAQPESSSEETQFKVRESSHSSY